MTSAKSLDVQYMEMLDSGTWLEGRQGAGRPGPGTEWPRWPWRAEPEGIGQGWESLFPREDRRRGEHTGLGWRQTPLGLGLGEEAGRTDAGSRVLQTYPLVRTSA